MTSLASQSLVGRNGVCGRWKCMGMLAPLSLTHTCTSACHTHCFDQLDWLARLANDYGANVSVFATIKQNEDCQQKSINMQL